MGDLTRHGCHLCIQIVENRRLVRGCLAQSGCGEHNMDGRRSAPAEAFGSRRARKRAKMGWSPFFVFFVGFVAFAVRTFADTRRMARGPS